MPQLGVQIVGSAVGYKAALGESLAATQKWASETEGAAVRVTESFKGVSTAALQSAAAADKLAIAYGRYGAGSLGAANATIAYRKQLEGLHASSLSALSAVGRNLTTYVSLPMAAVGYEAVKMGVEFQRQMLLIQTQAGASASEVKNLSGQVLDLAKVAPQGPVQLAQGLYHLESIGLRGDAAMRTLRTSALAAGMGIADLETVTTALGAAMVTGIKGAQSADQAMGLLNATVGAGNMRMQDLADALGTEILPKASNVGVSLDEVGAALATLTDRGVPAQKAATQLGTTFALMLSPSKAAQKALADMGIGATTLRTELAQPNGLLKALETLRSGMDRVGKGRGASDIVSAFGRSRQSGAILTLVESLGSGLSDYQHKLEQVDATQGKFGQNVKAYMQSPSYQLHSALSTLEADLIKIGDGLKGPAARAAQDFAKAINGIVDAVEKLPGPVKGALGVIAVGFAAAGPAALAIVGISKTLGALRTLFASLPLVAGPAAVKTGAEIDASVGGAVTTATDEVATLRTALLGLGRLVIPVITIQILEEFIPTKLKSKGQKGLELEGLGFAGHIPVVGGLAQLGTGLGISIDQALGIGGLPQGLPNQPSRIPKKYQGDADAAEAWISGYHGDAYPFKLGDPAHMADLNAYLAGRKAAGNVPGKQAGAGGSAAPKPGTPGGGAKPLTQAQQLAVALAANPDNQQLIEQQIAADNSAIAWLKRRREAGKISNADYVKQVDAFYSDRQAMQDRLASLDKKAATAAKTAAEFTVPLSLQIQQAAAALTAGTADDARANAQSAAYIRARLPHLSGQAELTALQDLAGLKTPAATPSTFAVPLGLQLAVAKAGASGDTAAQQKAAAAIKAYDEKLLASHKESIQSQIDIYNDIAQQNQVLGQQAVKGAYKAASLASLTAGISDPEVRRRVEARIAQAQAHSGHVPVGTAATYISVTGPIYAKDTNDLVDQLAAHGRRGTASRRGTNAGHYLGRH